VIEQPGGVHGKGDHSEIGTMIDQLRTGRLRFRTFGSSGSISSTVENVADGILLAHDKGRTGESYVLGGEITRLGEVLARVAALTGRRRSVPGRLDRPDGMAVRSSVMGADVRLASRLSRLGTESAFEVLARARALEEQGQKIVHLEIGEPDFDTPTHIVEAAAEALRQGFTHYVAAPGLPELREAVGEYFARTGRPSYPLDQVVVTPGAKPIMFFSILALCDDGDEVIYPDPGFPMYESISSFVGAKPVPVPLREKNDFRIDPDEVASLVTDRTRMLILNTPHNPCGSALTREDVEALATLANRHDFFVLSDEVYFATHYSGAHASIASLDGMQDRTILLDGCSKTFAMTGWRLGFCGLPTALVEPMTRLIINSVSCTAAFSQRAALAALTGPWEPVEAMVEEFHKRRGVIVDGLNRIEGISCLEPAGAFYVFPNVTGLGRPSEDVASFLLREAGVACLSGTAFGAQGQGYLRFSYANSIEAIRDALDAMESALPALSP
jgi:aspartate aminotransferase